MVNIEQLTIAKYEKENLEKRDRIFKRVLNIWNLIIFEVLMMVGFALMVFQSYFFLSVYERTQNFAFFKLSMMSLIWTAFMTFICVVNVVKFNEEVNKIHTKKKKN